MEIILDKKPAGVIIVEGFPGFGLIGTISTEFLIEHLGAVQIGKIKIEESSPVIAIHDGNVIDPIGVFYSKKGNIVILHALTSVKGVEWKLARVVEQLAKQLKAKEIISIEGIGSPGALPDQLSTGKSTEVPETSVFCLSNKKNKFDKLKIRKLQEGIVMGVTGALLLNRKLNLNSIFVETHSALPDSRAAAKAIETLNKYLNLKIDTKPLIQKAEKFEGKIKSLMKQSGVAEKHQREKELSYLG